MGRKRWILISEDTTFLGRKENCRHVAVIERDGNEPPVSIRNTEEQTILEVIPQCLLGKTRDCGVGKYVKELIDDWFPCDGQIPICGSDSMLLAKWFPRLHPES